MESGKIFDEATVVLMASIAAIGDLPLIFGWLGLLVPVVGLVFFGLIVIWNVLLVAILALWFIIKSVHSLNDLRELASLHGINEAVSYFAVGIIFGLGMLLGLILPVKVIAVLLSAFLANTRLGQIITQIGATVAVGAATGGVGAVAEVGAAAKGAAAVAEAGETAAGAAGAGEAAVTAGKAGVTAEETAAAETAGGRAAGSTEEIGPKKGTLQELKESLENIPQLEEEDEDDEEEGAQEVVKPGDQAEEDNSAELDDNVVDLKKAA